MKLGGGPKAPPPPPPPLPMPDMEDPAIIAERRRRMALESQRSGRASTILSGEYSGDTLGTR